MKIAFFGTPRLAQIILEKLITSLFKPHLIITAPDKKAGRGHQNQESPVKKTALKNKINVLQPEKLDKVNFEFDLAILVAYGQIVPPSILNIPKYGFVNVHPSILPKYRGPSPIQGAILNDEQKTGVSLIILDEQLDHGPILSKCEIKIDKTDTHQSLTEKLGKIGAGLLIETLPKYLAGKVKPKNQDHKKATMTKKITKKDGFIDLHDPPSPQTLDRMIRAFYSWPGVYTKVKSKNEKLKIIKFLPDSPFLIQPEGKRPLSLQQFKNGYPQLYSQIIPLLEKAGPLVEAKSRR